MTMVSIGSLGAGVANAAAGNSIAEPITAEAIYWPAWILTIGVLVALLIMIAVLASIKSALLAKPKKRDAEFTRMLCRQVWKHTELIKGTLHERLRHLPGDVTTLRVLTRLLREDLAPPMNFVEQMRAHPPATWPDYELFAAFNNWGGKISAIESQLGDLQQMLSYPAVREPVDPHRDAMLVHYFNTEQAPLSYAIGQVVTHAIAICEIGKTVLEKAHSPKFFGAQDEDAHDHHGCEACQSPVMHVPFGSDEPRLILMRPPEAPKKDKKEEKHAAAHCHCIVPQPCHCAPTPCICLCSCKASAKEPAAHH
ncbi:hypothetical protein [Sphingomonas sp. KR3-1]|uniref:hypothetical protein n=1 Tax=Sphingomonas sp. KR3-1 TaxID=3156611 RepID=UPI0032B60B0B